MVRDSQRPTQRDSGRRLLQGWSQRLVLRAAPPLQVVLALRVALPLRVVLALPVAALQAAQGLQPALAERL